MKEETMIKEGNILAPGIVVFENVIDNCQKYIDKALEQDNWYSGKIVNNDLSATENKNTRKCRNIDLTASLDDPVEWFELNKILWQYGHSYAKYFEIDFSLMELPQMLHYTKGEGFYKPHSDSGPTYPRIFSSLLYLNNVDSGGETYFNNFDLGIQPISGRLVMFPAQYPFMHESKSPISNDKFAVVTWFKQVINDSQK